MNLKAIDTHAHLSFQHYDGDREKLVKELEGEGIGVIEVADKPASFSAIEELVKSKYVWGMLGIHPLEVDNNPIISLPKIIEGIESKILSSNKIVGIGEIGLDYQYGMEKATKQHNLLRMLLDSAKKLDVPVTLHCRKAYGDLITLLNEFKPVKGVIHCYSGTLEQAESFLELGLNISFTASITYQANEELRNVAKVLPLSKIMLETDSPFLPGQSRRGQRNDPRTVLEVAEYLAVLHSTTKEKILDITTTNAQKLFKLGI